MGRKKKVKGPEPHCRRRGWPTLCRRFRKFLNEDTGPCPEGEFLEWSKKRVASAKKFIEQEGLEDGKANALINHVNICKMRGTRKCMACLDIEDAYK